MHFKAKTVGAKRPHYRRRLELHLSHHGTLDCGLLDNRPGLQINYQSIGSGGGIRQLKEGTVDFDAALDDHELQSMPALVQIPESAGPVCITYNLPELKAPLRLSGPTLAKIFLGEIQTWQDPAIAKDNPGVSLPGHTVVVGHRSDGSGTTNIFTTYLAKVSPDWGQKVGKGLAVNWPVGLGGKGSEGVAGLVKQTPGAIGYVELSYASENHLPVSKSRTGRGIGSIRVRPEPRPRSRLFSKNWKKT